MIDFNNEKKKLVNVVNVLHRPSLAPRRKGKNVFDCKIATAESIILDSANDNYKAI